MGWVSWSVSQLFVTSCTLGHLKRSGIIALKPEVVKNDSLRALIVQAVSTVPLDAGTQSLLAHCAKMASLKLWEHENGSLVALILCWELQRVRGWIQGRTQRVPKLRTDYD